MRSLNFQFGADYDGSRIEMCKRSVDHFKKWIRNVAKLDGSKLSKDIEPLLSRAFQF